MLAIVNKNYRKPYANIFELEKKVIYINNILSKPKNILLNWEGLSLCQYIKKYLNIVKVAQNVNMYVHNDADGCFRA